MGDAAALVGGADGHVLDEGEFRVGVDGDFFFDGGEEHSDDLIGGGQRGVFGDLDQHAGFIEAFGEPVEVAFVEIGAALPAEGPVVFVLGFDHHAEFDDGGEVVGGGAGEENVGWGGHDGRL